MSFFACPLISSPSMFASVLLASLMTTLKTLRCPWGTCLYQICPGLRLTSADPLAFGDHASFCLARLSNKIQKARSDDDLATLYKYISANGGNQGITALNDKNGVTATPTNHHHPPTVCLNPSVLGLGLRSSGLGRKQCEHD